jgi:hypothetical protein
MFISHLVVRCEKTNATNEKNNYNNLEFNLIINVDFLIIISSYEKNYANILMKGLLHE